MMAEICRFEQCRQEPSIKKLDEKMDKALDALLALSEQKVEIQHLIKTQGDHREWLKGHETRIQQLELQPGKVSSRFAWLLAGGAVSSVSALLFWIVTKG